MNNSTTVSTKKENAGHTQVGPPGLVSPFDHQTMAQMAADFIQINSEM